nr:unnamed protein product [Digitaria exilis]
MAAVLLRPAEASMSRMRLCAAQQRHGDAVKVGLWVSLATPRWHGVACIGLGTPTASFRRGWLYGMSSLHRRSRGGGGSNDTEAPGVATHVVLVTEV